MLENDIAYKNLLVLRDVLKMVLEMRCYKIVIEEKRDELEDCSVDKHLLHNYLENHSSFLSTIKRIEETQQQGLIDWSNPDVDKIILDESEKLATKYEDRQSDISKLELEIIRIRQAIVGLQAPPIELMRFLTKMPLGNPLKEIVKDLLRSLPHVSSKDVRNYLNNECEVTAWYNAYFIENPTAKKEDYQRNLDELLESILDPANPSRIPVIDNALNKYKNCEGLVIDIDILKRLIDAKRFSKIDNADLVLSLIYYSEIPLSGDLTVIIRKLLIECSDIDDNWNRYVKLTRLFETCFYLVKDYRQLIRLFSICLAGLKEADNMAESLENYLSIVYKDDDYKEYFVEQYLKIDQELKEKRQQMVMVLKSANQNRQNK